ncbi:hypothetical protein [Micromonospora sp. NPDC023633]
MDQQVEIGDGASGLVLAWHIDRCCRGVAEGSADPGEHMLA